MDESTNLQISKELKETLEKIATEKNTNLETTIKLILIENEELTKPPANYITTSKISKNKSTYSTVIPAPIKNKLGLVPKQVLYWDIDDDNNIKITPAKVTKD